MVELKVQFLFSIKHPDDAEPMFLTEEQAKEVYDYLHARFGDKQLIGFPVPHPLFDRITNPTRPPLEVGRWNPFDGPTSTMRGPGIATGLNGHRIPLAERGEKPAENPWDLVTGIVPETESREPDDADEQEAEFLSRLPQDGNKRDLEVE